MATRSRWGGVETRQSTVQQKVTIKRDAQRTFRVKERQRAEPLSSPRSVQQVFGGEAEPYPRAYHDLNTTYNKGDDSDSSGGWDRDSLGGGGRHRAGRLAKSVTTANLHAGAREARSRGHGLSASRSSTSINEAGAQKPRTKTNNIDRLVDRLSKPQKRESRSGSTDTGPGRRRRSDVPGRTERASPVRRPAVEFRRSNTFDLDEESEEDPLRVRRRDKKPAASRGRVQNATPPRDFHRSNTFEKDVDEAPVSRGSDAPSVAWPTNVQPEDEDASSFRVNTRHGPEPVRTTQQVGGTFTRRKKTERASASSNNRWSMYSDDGREDPVGLRASTENVTSLFSRAGLATRDNAFMSSTPDLSAFTASRDHNSQFPSGKKERTRAKESPDSSISSGLSRKPLDVTFEASPSARDRTPRGGRVDFDEILERASRRRRPSGGSAGGEPPAVRRGSFSIDRPAAESGQSPYRSVFTSEEPDLPRVKSSPHVPKQREEHQEPGARGVGTPESAGRADGYSRRFRGIFKSRRDSDESDNSGKDTGFSSGRSNSPRDSMPPDSLSGRGGRPGGARPAGRLFDREATISPSRSQRSSSPSKSGSTTPRRQPSPDRRLTPSPTRLARSSARSAGSPERFGGSRRPSGSSSVSEASSRWGRARGGASRAQEQPPPEVEALLTQDQEWMRELTEEDEEQQERPASHPRQPPSLPTRDIDSDSVTAPELASDSDIDYDRTLMADSNRMQHLLSTQQEESVSAPHEKQLTAKEELISFSPAEDTLKKRPVAPVEPSPAPPDVAQPPASPAPAPAPAPAVSSQEQKTQELMLQEKLLKRDREIKVLQETVAKLKQQLAASQAAQQRMAKVAERHSSALAQLAASRVHQETQQAQQLRRLKVERDEAREEVANIETMFADLHRKYEKSKSLVAENRQSSDLVSAELDHALSQVSREQQRYDMLQQYAEDTMQRLQADMELEQKSQETETLRMSARLQLAENRATKLERENQEVTAICDELIQKMGGAR